MSKFSNMLNMIILLKSNGKMKIKELAEALEVDERMIRKYKEDLEKANIYIKTIHGTNGGYVLDGADYLVNLSLAEDEFIAMQLAYEQLKSIDFIYSKEFEILLHKLNLLRRYKLNAFDKVEYLIKSVRTINTEDERKKCLNINKAIILKNKLKIKYFSLSSGESERTVHPYAVISYKGAQYFAAYCEKRNKILDFKLSRIKDYEILKDKFVIQEGFSLKDYMENSIGIYKGETLNVKLKIYKDMSYIVSEKIWVENQKITWNDDESIIFEAQMKGKPEIISWILSMGSKVEVLEPESLVDDLKNEIEKMKYRYK